MPKIKTHSSAKKRFKVTGSGKIMMESAGARHLMRGKAKSRLNRLAGESVLKSGDAKRIKRLLGLR
jgi:large subunit ribosomal protein L35